MDENHNNIQPRPNKEVNNSIGKTFNGAPNTLNQEETDKFLANSKKANKVLLSFVLVSIFLLVIILCLYYFK